MENKMFFKSFKKITLIMGGFVLFGIECGEASTLDKTLTDAYTVHFQNPEYKPGKTAEFVDIPNGSMINFASSGVIGKTIRAASALNAVQNPLGLTHSGIVINENPRYIFSKVLSLTEGSSTEYAPLSEKAGKAILRELTKYHRDVISMTEDPKIIRSFAIESDGSVSEVLKGIAPHTHIHDLSHRISDYGGNVYIRPLNEGIDYKYSRKFLKEYLGRPYEGLKGIRELLGSVVGANEKERTENVFCSELCACFYKGAGLLSPALNVSNVIPEYFGSSAGENDLLAGKALDDVPMKLKYSFSESDVKGKGCCGFFFSCCRPGEDIAFD